MEVRCLATEDHLRSEQSTIVDRPAARGANLEAVIRIRVGLAEQVRRPGLHRVGCLSRSG